MGLLELYQSATTSAYIEKVTKQTSGSLENSYFDGTRLSTPQSASLDKFQKQFDTNPQGSYRVGGAQAIPRAADITTWTSEAYKLAFDGYAGTVADSGPAGLPKGFYKADNNQFRSAKNSKGVVGTVHNYIPTSDVNRAEATSGGYINLNASARAKYNANPSGVTP